MQRMLCVLFFVLCFGAAAIPQTDKRAGKTFGFELDAFPYINNGYYGSAWVGTGDLRLRGVIAKTTVPSFVVAEGFSDLNTAAYAFIADYFFKENYEGWWIGAGAEYWHNSIKNSENNISADFDNVQITLGGGCVWKIWKNFYINPWCAIHLRAGGDAEKSVGGKRYESSLLLPEASVKIGWHY